MATDIIARGMITEYKSGTNIDFKENEDGSVTISASGDVSSEDTVARDTIDNHKLDKNNPHNVTAEQVGLGNVNNTSDLDKPISTAVQMALNDKANTKHTHKKSDITDFPNSLPANGGDADTVNGFGVAEYVATLPEGEYYTEAARINTRDKKIESCDTSNLKVGLAERANYATNAMNAGTVNNHTVDSDVPANAVFTDTTNSDVTIVGNPVQLDGLQGGVPFSEMAVSGKNLLKYPYYTTTKTINGITFTDNGDGTITANGTATAISSFALIWKNIRLPKGTYTISGCPENGNVNTGFFAVCGTDSIRFATDTGNGGTFAIDDDTNDFTFSIRVNSGVTVDNIVFRPQLELGSTLTAYEPPITGRDLTVNVCGKNLMKYPYYNTTQTQNGVTFTDNGDGSITVNGTATATAYFSLSSNKALPTGKYVLGKSMDNILLYVDKYLDNAFYQRLATSTETIKELIFNVSEEDAQKYTYKSGIQLNKGNTEDNVTIYPQLELGDSATPYEPYHGSTTTITPTSNPYTIPDDIRQQDGLNVVSVSEGKISVTGVRKNAAVKRIWDEMGMDLLFDGVTSADNPAVVNLANYNMIRIDVSGNYAGTTYFNCGSTYLSKSTLDFAFESYGCVAIPASVQAIIINISKSGAEYSLSFSGFNEKQLVDVIKIYGIK